MKHKFILSAILVFILSHNLFGQSSMDATIQHDGMTREYRIYVPALYDGSQPVPLVLNFHGYGSNNAQQEFYGEFRPIADTANFIIVLPQGTLNSVNSTFWNTFGGPETVDDVGFISDLLDTLSANYNIDQNRIYSTGMSNGGFMSYKLACELSSRITAIASVTGSMIFEELNACNPPRPIPVMQIHGTADDVVEYDGGASFVPIETLVDFWSTFNNCDPQPVFEMVPDINTSDNSTAERYVYENGDLGSTVEFYKVIGGEHTWPGTIINIGVTNRDFNASQEIWRFFSQYERSGLTTSIDEPQADLFSASPFPNPSEGQFILEFNDLGDKTILISNNLGQVISQVDFSGNRFELSLDHAGLYFVTVIRDDERQTEKILVY